MATDKTDDLIISISTDLATVRRSLKKLEGDIASTSGNVVKQFDKMGKGIDTSMTSALQTRIDKMVGIGTQGAKEWTGALADQGKELERLRARYSPLFSTLNTYKNTVSDIRRAHAVGAISATEMTAAITRERQAALASTAAIKGRNAALKDTPAARRGGDSFNTANLAAQFQDIGVTAAMGMSPLQIALQQGTQISAVLGPMGAAGAVKSLGAAFLSVINPVSLATIGLVAASAAAIQYFSGVDWGGGKSEETLKKEAELIDAVTQKWGEALPALKAYNDARAQLAGNADIKEAAGIAADEQWEDLRKQVSDVNIEFTDMASRLAQLGKDETAVGELQRSFNDLANSIEDGTATTEQAKKVQDELLKLVKDGANPEIEAFAKTFDALGLAIGNASGKASKFKTEAAVLVDLVKQLGPLGQLGPIISGDGKFLINADDQQNYRAQQEANKNPLIESNGRMMGVPTPGEKPIQLGDEPNKKAETAAQRTANAYRDLLKSADDRIAQLRLETELTGEYGTATDAARFRLDLLQQAEDKGRSLAPEQRAEIEQKVAAYEKYSQALAEAKLKQDLLDKQRFAGMSEREQEITRTLRGYGLSEDLGGDNAASIRKQLQSEELTSATDAFFDDFSAALLSGGDDIGKRLGQVLLSAFMDSAQDQITVLLKQLFSAFLSGGKGGAASPVGSVASAFAAPVGAISRSALADVLPSGDIAAYIAQSATKHGIDPSIALKVAKSEGGLNSWNRQSDFVKNGVREQSYGPFQLYKGGGLGNVFQRQTGMDPALASSGPAGVDFAMGHAAKNGWGAWYGADKVGVGNWDGIGKGASTASAALEKLAGASTETTKGLGSLASSLVSGGAGGSGFNFGSLFSSSFKPNTTLGNFIQGIPGFAKGTNNAPRGMAIVGEDGPELVHFRGGERVVPNNRLSPPRAPALRQRAAATNNAGNPNTLQVNINGASGDPHVRELVRQGVQEALAGQNEQMRRGQFGQMQDRYVSQRR